MNTKVIEEGIIIIFFDGKIFKIITILLSKGETDMKRRKVSARMLSVLLAAATVASGMPVTVSADETSGFEKSLTAVYSDPDRKYQSDVRWWLAEASNTDEVLLQEIQNMYDAGFHGVELCMQGDDNAPDDTYAYGSEMWSHKWKLMMNSLLDHGMEVSLTSGTNWSTSNVPGLDPDSQEASQVAAMGTVIVDGGTAVTELPKPETQRETNAGKFLGAYAYKITGQEEESLKSKVPWVPELPYTCYSVEYDSMIDLSEETTFTEGTTIYDQAMEWTAPDDGQYLVVGLWTHGNYETASPAAETCYATNYFDERGVEALKTFWEAHYLDDPELNEKIKEGDVQLFMDSLEITPEGGITWWTEEIRQEFIDRKGYDILPYLFLVDGLPQVYAVFNPYIEPAKGHYDLEGNADLREKIINDWVDVLTQLYCENMLVPLKEWLNSVGIETRAQISYGRSFEITEPSMYVDYPEAENLNQYDNVDVLRLHTAGAKLQNKMLSTETGASLSTYATSAQSRLKQIYDQYAAGFQRVIWHIWSTSYTYGEESAWPGWGNSFDRWGDRETDFRDMDEFNAHIGRVQELLQTGKARTDVAFIHNNWNQGILCAGGIGDDITGMNYQQAHMGVYYRSTELQDNGYTYDYLSPDLLSAENVYFDEETKTIELAGYKAVVLYQDWLDVAGAEKILEWAKKGLKVVILDGAAVRTPFNDGQDEKLAAVMEELKALDTVRTAEIYDASEDFNYFDAVAEGYSDGVLEALKDLGVTPYAGYAEPNHQLLTQARADENGNEYLYVYNYCSNDYHQNSHIDSVKTEDHGTNIKTEIEMDGTFIPYAIDAWSGEVTELGEYRYEDGKTVFPVDLDYANIALYAFEAADGEGRHIVSTDAQEAYAKDGNLYIRATESGDYAVELSDGETVTKSVEVPTAYDITDWNLSVESWTPGTELIYSKETIGDVNTVNTKMETVKNNIDVKLDKLSTWDNIPEIGGNVSGLGHYEASFNWDSKAADGAYLDFGDGFVSTMKVWINGQKVGGDFSQNPTKAKASIAEGAEGTEQYTGGIDWTKPVADISEYLKDGENTIVLEYSSTLTNVALSNGIIEETENASGWWKNDTKYQSYGPSQAVIIPFAEETV